MGNNLRALREKKHWTHQEAAEAMGVSRSQFIKLERGERRLNDLYIMKAAQAFGVTQADVISEGRGTVPIVGYVGAGSTAHFYVDADAPTERVPMPPGGTEATVAVEARGDSLGPFFRNWLIYYDEIRYPPTEDLLGELCVVELIDGRVLVKMLMRGPRPGSFNLYSQTETPIEDVELVWAAKVTAMTPR